MTDASVSPSIESPEPGWVFLLYRIPARPAYFRVKVSRRLERVGAVLVKNSVYALPFGEEAVEHFHWLCAEIRDSGGEASVAIVTTLDPQTEDQLRSGFGLPERASAEVRAAAHSGEGKRPLRGRTWVTRSGVGVDRIASAWLIRRWIDLDARLKFVPAVGYAPEPGELRFDMYDGEFTHAGNRCTLEVLLDVVGETDEALVKISEMVHDIDLRDDRRLHPETAGLAAMIEGLVRSTRSDEERIAHGASMLDRLYEALRTADGDPGS